MKTVCKYDRNEKMGYKIREARLEKVPFILVVGDKEMETETVAVRSRREGELGAMDVNVFVDKVVQEIKDRVL